MRCWRAGRKANNLIKQQAVLCAELRRMGRDSSQLIVANTGQGAASNVTITLDGKPLLEHRALMLNKKEIKLIEPKSDISYLIKLNPEWPPLSELKATWDDDSGQPGQYRTTLPPLMAE